MSSIIGFRIVFIEYVSMNFRLTIASNLTWLILDLIVGGRLFKRKLKKPKIVVIKLVISSIFAWLPNLCFFRLEPNGLHISTSS